MKPESRTPLHVTVFVCIITLLIMTACGIGKTGSGNGGTRYPDESFAQNQIPRPRSPHKIHNNILLTGVLQLQNPFIKVQIYNSTITQKIQWEAGWIRRLMAFSGMCMNQGITDTYKYSCVILP